MRKLLLLVFAAACGGVKPIPPTGDAAPSGSLRLDPPSLEFGDVAIGGGRSILPLTVTNDGIDSGPVVAAATGMDAASFGVSRGCEAPLAAGESCAFDLYVQTSHQGAHTAILDVALAGERASATLGANGVVAQLLMSATSDDFGDVGIAASATRTYTLSNVTTVPLDGVTLAISGDAAFTLDSTTCTPSLAAGATCDVMLRVAPIGLGKVDGMLVATASATGASATLAVTGRGTTALTVTRDGTGGGSVQGGPIDCGQTCDAVLGAPITLTATPATGSRFLRWNGAASSCGTNPTCNVPLTTASVAAIATFADLPTLFVHVSNSGSTGVVVVTPPALTCLNDCPFDYAAATTVTLEANDNNDTCNDFVGWTGACSGKIGTCTITVSADTSVSAAWRRNPVCDF